MRKSNSTTTAVLPSGSEDITSVQTRGTLTSSKKKKKQAENESISHKRQDEETLSAVPHQKKMAMMSPHAPLTLSSFTSKSLAEADHWEKGSSDSDNDSLGQDSAHQDLPETDQVKLFQQVLCSMGKKVIPPRAPSHKIEPPPPQPKDKPEPMKKPRKFLLQQPPVVQQRPPPPKRELEQVKPTEVVLRPISSHVPQIVYQGPRHTKFRYEHVKRQHERNPFADEDNMLTEGVPFFQ